MKSKTNTLITASMAMGACLVLLLTCEEVEPTLKPNITVATVDIPAGTFVMGSPLDEPNRQTDEVEHVVTLNAFRMSIHEITNAEYVTFLNAKKVDRYGYYPKGAELTKSLVRLNTSWGVWYSNNEWVPVEGYEDHPVIDVTWFGANEFAKYAGGRLPTEAEWEYACRADSTTPFNTGTCLSDADANYFWDNPYITCINASSTSPGRTQPVGSYAANAFGLFDMHGNVWEWCDDTFGGNPILRVLRGGSWAEDAWVCRSARRFMGEVSTSHGSNPELYGTVGFRIVLDQ